MDDNITKPTIGTLIERMNGLEERLGARLEGLGDRLDRIESIGNITRGEMLEFRADFRAFRNQLKDQFPVPR